MSVNLGMRLMYMANQPPKRWHSLSSFGKSPCWRGKIKNVSAEDAGLAVVVDVHAPTVVGKSSSHKSVYGRQPLCDSRREYSPVLINAPRKTHGQKSRMERVGGCVYAVRRPHRRGDGQCRCNRKTEGCSKEEDGQGDRRVSCMEKDARRDQPS